MKTDSTPNLTPKLRFPTFRDKAAWEPKILGNEGQFLPSLTGKSAQHFGAGSAKYVTYMNVFSNTFTDMTSLGTVDVDVGESQCPVTVGDLLLTVSSETPEDAGMSSVVLDDVKNCYLNSFCTIFRFTEQKRPNLRFLGYLMRQPLVRAWLAERAQGSTRFNLSKAVFRSLPIALPPAAEQQEITECLSALDELVYAESQKLDALKAHKRALTQQLFPREGESVPLLRFPEFQDAPEWEERTLADIAKISSGTTPARADPKNYLGGSIPWVKTADLNNSFITHTDENVTPLAKVRINPAGSVLVAMYGGFNQIGRTGLLSVPAATNQAISVLVVDQTIATPAYVLAWLNAKVVTWRRIASSSRKDPNITGSDVARFSINMPQIAEQKRIASCLSSIDALVVAQSDKLEVLKAHRKGLMQQLFPSPVELET